MDQELNQKIDAFIAANREQLLDDIAALVAINSVETVLSDRQELFKGMNLQVEWEIGLDRLAESLPMMSFLSLFPYTQMLHYTLTGEKVARSQIAMQQGPPGKPSSQKPGRRLYQHFLCIAHGILV